MTKIKIDIDSDKSRFLLIGDVNKISSDKIMKSYLKNYLEADFIDDNTISVPFERETQEDVLKRIHEFLSRYSIEKIHSETTKEVLDEFLIEEKNFEKFSEKAMKIRDNKCEKREKEEFKTFSNIIKEKMKRVLYPLQLLSAYHLTFSQNACNFSVPGSGKTSIVYAAYTYMKNLAPEDAKHVDRLLVIGPLNSFGPWEQEYKECFGRNASSKRIHGQTPKEDRIRYLYSSNPAEITLISYQGVKSIVTDLIPFLKRQKAMVVLDEAHKIKNVEGGVIAASVLSLARLCKARIVLTGTPVPNGYQDLLNLYKFIWPTKDIVRFRKYQLKEMSQNMKDSRIDRLIEYISPFFIRIKKSDLKLPNPIENPPIRVKMGPEQKYIYDFVESKYMQYFLKEEKAKSFKDVLTRAKLIRLMQAASNPSLLRKPLDEYFHSQGFSDNIFVEESEIIRKIVGYEKLETPKKFIEAEKIVRKIIERSEKVVVWVTFIQNIFDFQKYLDKKGIESKVIYGGTPVDFNQDNEGVEETREKIIKEFHEANSFKVLIANPFAVSESISLHKACHNAIYLERTFNAGHFIQSKDRIHRYGLAQNDRINYYYILSENTIDETINERLKFKEQRMNKIIEKPIPLFFNLEDGDLVDEDIKALIDDYVKRANKA
jgi:SNF2 family DNA or RNA helicase